MPWIDIEHRYLIGDCVYLIDAYYSQTHQQYLKVPVCRQITDINIHYRAKDKFCTLRYVLDDGRSFKEEELFRDSTSCRKSIDDDTKQNA